MQLEGLSQYEIVMLLLSSQCKQKRIDLLYKDKILSVCRLSALFLASVVSPPINARLARCEAPSLGDTEIF